jgi:hypothetical protein
MILNQAAIASETPWVPRMGGLAIRRRRRRTRSMPAAKFPGVDHQSRTPNDVDDQNLSQTRACFDHVARRRKAATLLVRIASGVPWGGKAQVGPNPCHKDNQHTHGCRRWGLNAGPVLISERGGCATSSSKAGLQLREDFSHFW